MACDVQAPTISSIIAAYGGTIRRWISARRWRARSTSRTNFVGGIADIVTMTFYLDLERVVARSVNRKMRARVVLRRTDVLKLPFSPFGHLLRSVEQCDVTRPAIPIRAVGG